MTIVEKALENLYSNFPEQKEVEYWAGCNYYVNKGANEAEPIGTASSMHDCSGCEKVSYCKIKKAKPIWIIDEDVKSQMKSDWKETLEIEEELDSDYRYNDDWD